MTYNMFSGIYHFIIDDPFEDISRIDESEMTQEDEDALFEFGGLFLVYQLYENYIKEKAPL